MFEQKNKKTQLLIRLSEKERLQIENNAKTHNKTISAYIREVAFNMCLIEIDSSCVTKHTSEISSYRNAITQLIFTIKRTGS